MRRKKRRRKKTTIPPPGHRRQDDIVNEIVYNRLEDFQEDDLGTVKDLYTQEVRAKTKRLERAVEHAKEHGVDPDTDIRFFEMIRGSSLLLKLLVILIVVVGMLGLLYMEFFYDGPMWGMLVGGLVLAMPAYIVFSWIEWRKDKE